MHQGPPSATGGFVSSVSLPIIRRSINTRTDTGNRLTLLFCAYEMMSKTDGSLWKHWFSLPKIHQNFSWSLRRLDKPRQKNRLKKRQEEPEETLITINYAVEGLSVRASEHYEVSFVFSLFPLDSSLTYEDSIRKHQYLSGIPFARSWSLAERRTLREIFYVSAGLQEILKNRYSSRCSWYSGLGFYWRIAREGFQVNVSRKFPSLKEKQKEGISIKFATKMGDLRKKFYIGPLGLISGDVDYLSLQKGIDPNGVLLVTPRRVGRNSKELKRQQQRRSVVFELGFGETLSMTQGVY